MTRRSSDLRRSTGALIFFLTGLLACENSGPIAPPIIAADAKGDGAPVKVNQAVPSEAPQDTSLTVLVFGSGYDPGSEVEFLLAGQSTLKMDVTETRYVSGTELEADLTIAVDADPALYDIEVTTARGKKGIGTEKFAVKVTGAPPPDIPVSATFRDASGDGVLSDGVLPPDDAYDGTILELGNMFIDARVDIPRQLCMDFPVVDPPADPPPPDDLCDDAYMSTADPSMTGGIREMPVGGTITSRAQVTWVKDGYNWALRFGMDCNNDDDTPNRVQITHPDADTWSVEGANARLCRMKTKGRPSVEEIPGVFSMPFQITLVRQN